MTVLLQHLHESDYTHSIRIDTNGSWAPWDVPHSKVTLMVSYHPSEAKEFWHNLDRLQVAGWIVAVVTYVVTDQERCDELPKVKEKLDWRNIALNVLPGFTTASYYTQEQLAIMQQYVPPEDWPYRIGERTRGRPCLFPSIAYEMQPSGLLKVGCHEDKRGSIFDAVLPYRFISRTPCPHEDCFCIDKYTFLLDKNLTSSPLRDLAGRIRLL